MYLAGVVSGTSAHIHVDMGTTHNIIDINIARHISLQEQRINTAILVGSGNEVPCCTAAFSVPLGIDADVFDIDTYLLDIGNNVDIILDTAWLVGLGCLTWDFSTMELQYINNGHPITFTTMQPQRTLATVHALPAPPPIYQVQEEAPLPPRNILSRASQARHPNAPRLHRHD